MSVVDPSVTQMAITAMAVGLVLVVLNFIDRLIERRDVNGLTKKTD